ncbi:MAG TPA: hypothetical protein VHG30_03115 [Microvirga sp.]|nr:hypothetical protein [Microvirga sp.]
MPDGGATAWASPDDGILVIDLAEDGAAGPDGRITNVMEVAFARWFTGATTDLMGLRRAFDANGDNLPDSRDPRFAEFRIWRDAA